MGLVDYLIGQSKNPHGFIGKIMLKIMNNAHRDIFYTVLKRIEIKNNYKLLDLDCGGGKFINIISKKYNDIKLYGIDISEESIVIAKNNNKNDIKNGKMEIIKADIIKMPFENNYFDIITAIQTHYYWKNIKNSIEEIYRILKYNETFIMAAELYKINYHMDKYKTKEEIIKLFIRTGFKKIEYKEDGKYMNIKGIKI
ncbi:SAM-dependent methyltransferase [Spirochaetia bacterium]|nr:SAM-dependent methyltransferase [Spirochaetia bacterium]